MTSRNDTESLSSGQASGITREPLAEALACVSCRSRKLKCDRQGPKCGRCSKANADCVYPESRRKPTVKRRNVKELEARLAQVEQYLKDTNRKSSTGSGSRSQQEVDDDEEAHGSDIEDVEQDIDEESAESSQAEIQGEPWKKDYEASQSTVRDGRFDQTHQNTAFTPMLGNLEGNIFSSDGGQVLGLGQSETLPPFEVIEELHNLFFQGPQQYMPIIHPARYYQAFYGGHLMKPPMCLQYAIWALAALGHDKYGQHADIFYKRARLYLEADEMKGGGEQFITIRHAQALALVSTYEASRVLFIRASLNAAKCARFVMMLGLDVMDDEESERPPTIAPPLSWAEKEERRRALWIAFCIDAYGSVSTGWPSFFDYEGISCRLPSSEEAFVAGREETAPFLNDVLEGDSSYSSFASTIVVCNVFKMVSKHNLRSKKASGRKDLANGKFWSQHRDLDNTLSSLFMFLPQNLQLLHSHRNHYAVHANLGFHATVISLHHTALAVIDQDELGASTKTPSLCRLRTAAEEIANIIKISAHTMAKFRSPLASVALYCAATVYIYFARTSEEPSLSAADKANFEIIVHGMEAISQTNELTKGFLQHVCMDLERNNLESIIRMPRLYKFRSSFKHVARKIPLFARSSVYSHKESSQFVPGLQPSETFVDSRQGGEKVKLGKGLIPDLEFSFDDELPAAVRANPYQPMLASASHNLHSETRDTQRAGNKRRRTSPSRGPGLQDFSMGADVGTLNPFAQQLEETSGDLLRAFHGIPTMLPDRTSPSSAESSLPHDMNAETQPGSDYTSPSVILGLGNTAEENRIDLRHFQGRIGSPLWPSMPTEEPIFGQVSESLIEQVMQGDRLTFYEFMNSGGTNWAE